MTHLIEKQIIELRLTSTKNAFELQQKVSTFCSAQLMPALDDLFSRLAPMHTHIRIDELVIDLGTISEKDMLSNVFLQEILARIERTIQAQIRDNPERTVRTDKETDVFLKWLYFLENGRLPWFSRGTPPSFEADVPKVLAQSEAAIVQLRSLLMQQPTALQRLIQQHPPTFLALIAGLYTGRIQTDLVQVAAALEHFVNRESAQFFWNKVFKRVIFIREKWTVRDVIVHTLGDLLNTLVRQGFIEGNSLKEILPPNFPFLKETEAFLIKEQPNNAWILRLQQETQRAEQAAFLEKKEGENTIDTSSEKELALSGEEIETSKSKAVEPVNPVIHNTLSLDEKKQSAITNEIVEDTLQDAAKTTTIDFVEKNEGNTLTKQENTEGVEKSVKTTPLSEKEQDKVTNKTIDDKATLVSNQAVDVFEQLKNTEGVSNVKDSQAEARAMGEIPREMYISNAGIVLLHPFLNRLFENLGLTKDNVFINESMRHKALGVLHYLATGEAAVLEYNLILPKLLCQMPLNMPVDGHCIVSKKDKKECDKLLKIAIDYWSALGKTSAAGLREAFLQRKGKLINRPSGWLLQVERTTIDVLIDRLPWGLGIVKLPWMRDFLTVEW